LGVKFFTRVDDALFENCDVYSSGGTILRYIVRVVSDYKYIAVIHYRRALFTFANDAARTAL